jgi:hypothetical protein
MCKFICGWAVYCLNCPGGAYTGEDHRYSKPMLWNMDDGRPAPLFDISLIRQ